MYVPSKGLFAVMLMLAVAPALASGTDPAPAVAPPPPAMGDPGPAPASASASAEQIRPDDPRLAPLPPEYAPVDVKKEPVPQGPSKSDGDPTNLPALPTDDAFHPPARKIQETETADGYSVRSYTTDSGDHIEEYRHGGQLTEVRVQPLHGKAFELRDTNKDGRINANDATSSQLVPVQWKLFEWH